jgi:nucleotide-binding universal stress UspA family protein
MKEIKKIVLATDFSKASQNATQYAKTLAKGFKVPLMILHVFDPKGPDLPAPYFAIQTYAEWLKDNIYMLKKQGFEMIEELAKSCEAEGVNCQKFIIEGNPGEEIVKFVREREVDLLIIGTHGYSGLERLIMGSVAGYVFHHANCVVLTVKQDKK